MISVSPVFTDEFVDNERVIALDQKEYAPIVILPVPFNDGTVGLSVRFRLTAEELQAVLDGADIVITEITSTGRSFTPISVDVCKPNTNPFKS